MTTPSSELRSIIDRLPFPVDDTDAVNGAFRRWVEGGDPEAARVVDLWTYAYLSRYFLSKSKKGVFDSASDVDQLITRAYHKVQRKRDEVRDPDCYASWVSVICKNTLLNYTRRDHFSESIDDEEGPELTADQDRPVVNLGFVREALTEAIEKLPEYLQEPAQLYFLEDRGFEEISEEVGKPVATIRTYKYKAAKRLRTDERLREYIDQPDF